MLYANGSEYSNFSTLITLYTSEYICMQGCLQGSVEKYVFLPFAILVSIKIVVYSMNNNINISIVAI